MVSGGCGVVRGGSAQLGFSVLYYRLTDLVEAHKARLGASETSSLCQLFKHSTSLQEGLRGPKKFSCFMALSLCLLVFFSLLLSFPIYPSRSD